MGEALRPHDHEFSRRQAVAVAEMPQEAEVLRRFEARFLSALALSETVAPPSIGPTLAKSVDRFVRTGDKVSESIVDINVGTAASEGVFKDDHATEVEKYIDSNGQVSQNGLSSHQMNADSFNSRPGRHQILKWHTLAEALNGYREQQLASAGVLKTHYFIASSAVPEGLSEEHLDERGDGFFTKTMTYNLQATTEESNKIVMQTAFRRGTTAGDTSPFSIREAQRYDIAAIGMVYEWLGLKAPQSALELLQQPILVPKEMLPGGVADFLKLCDRASSVITGQQLERPPEFYDQLLAESRRKEAGLMLVKMAVKQELLGQAGRFATDTDANDLLWELVKKHAVAASGTNLDINPMVFGHQAKIRIERARLAAAAGDYARMERWLISADRVATISGCGGGVKRKGNDNDPLGIGLNDFSEQEAETAESDTWHGGKKHKNAKCRGCNEVKAEVGACHICEDCVKHPAKMQASYAKFKNEAEALLQSGSAAESIARSFMDYLGSIAAEKPKQLQEA